MRHLFIPHHTNNHRPKILHHNSLAAVIVLLLGLTYILPIVKNQYPAVLGTSVNISTQELVSLTNKKRAEAGLAPLSLSGELSNAAAAKASYMLEKDFWAHVAPDGTTPWFFIKNSGYEYQYAGENLARGFSTADEVVNAWMESPTHRENLLSPNYKDIGFAVTAGNLTGADTVLVVQEFGSRYVSSGNTANLQVPSISPALSIMPTAPPGEGNTEPEPIASRPATSVAAAVNNPLVDSRSTSQNVSIVMLGLFIAIFVIDGIYIERKKISRALSHNLDHVIFLTILVIAVIIIGGGAVL